MDVQIAGHRGIGHGHVEDDGRDVGCGNATTADDLDVSTPPAVSGAADGTPFAVLVSRIRVGVTGRYWPSQPEGTTAFEPPDWLAPTLFDAVTLKM
jgi:hypothetical protein